MSSLAGRATDTSVALVVIEAHYISPRKCYELKLALARLHLTAQKQERLEFDNLIAPKSHKSRADTNLNHPIGDTLHQRWADYHSSYRSTEELKFEYLTHLSTEHFSLIWGYD